MSPAPGNVGNLQSSQVSGGLWVGLGVIRQERQVNWNSQARYGGRLTDQLTAPQGYHQRASENGGPFCVLVHGNEEMNVEQLKVRYLH